MRKLPGLLFIQLLFLICFSPVSRAQEFVFSKVSLQQYSIPWVKGNLDKYEPGNTILREISKDILKQPWLVRIHVRYSLDISVKLADGRPQLELLVLIRGIEGDTRYRSFPINDVLIPDRVQLKLKWASKADTSSFTETVFRDRLVGAGDSLVVAGPMPAFDPRVDTLMVRNIIFHYDSLALAKFMNRLWLINDYYASRAILDSLGVLSEGIVLDDPASLPLAFMQVQEFDKIVARIDARNFPGGLLASGYDPKGFMEKFVPLFKHARSVNFTFRDELLKCGAIPWRGDLDLLAGYFTGRMLSYVHRAQLMDGIHGKIYQEYLDQWYTTRTFGDDLQVMETMLAKMYPDAARDTLVSFVSKHIYSSYQQRSLQLMDEGRFADAFSLMENAVHFRENNPFFKNGTGSDKILSKAANGIYSSYAGIASSCIDAGKMTMADEYLHKAQQYRIARSSYISSDSLYQAVFSRLFFIRNADCHRLLEQSKYTEALECYRSFEQTYDSRSLAAIRPELDLKIGEAQRGQFYQLVRRTEESLRQNEADSAIDYFGAAVLLQSKRVSDAKATSKLDSLAPLIAALQYVRLFDAGSASLDRRQFTLALSKFDEAKRLSAEYGMAADPELEERRRNSMKHSLLIRLSSNQKKIWNNQFDSARIFLAQVERTALESGLSGDPDLMQATARYNERIGEQLCRNLSDSVELRLIRADRWRVGKNYIRTVELLREAITLSVTLSECRYPVKQVIDSIQKYTQAAAFQQKLSDASTHAATGAYDLVISDLENAAVIHTENRLDLMGLSPVTVAGFLEQRENPLLTERAAGYYLGKSDYLMALRFLQMMRIQNYPERSATELQRQLGTRLAAVDFMSNPKDPVAARVGMYTGNQPWYKAFSSAYEVEWSRLFKVNSPK